MGGVMARQELALKAKGRHKQIAADLGVAISTISESLSGELKTVDRLFDIADVIGHRFVLEPKDGPDRAEIISIRDRTILQAIEILRNGITSDDVPASDKADKEDKKLKQSLLDRLLETDRNYQGALARIDTLLARIDTLEDEITSLKKSMTG